jgi:hypothetical protein
MEAFMLLEVGEILHVERREGELTDKTTRGDLAVIDRSRPARRCGPQCRMKVHWVSSPTVTKVIAGGRPFSR